jgi:hypothetical protein
MSHLFGGENLPPSIEEAAHKSFRSKGKQPTGTLAGQLLPNRNSKILLARHDNRPVISATPSADSRNGNGLSFVGARIRALCRQRHIWKDAGIYLQNGGSENLSFRDSSLSPSRWSAVTSRLSFKLRLRTIQFKQQSQKRVFALNRK